MHRLEVHGGSEIVPRVRTWATTVATELGAEPQAAADFALAISEACTNIVHHAYFDRPGSRLILTAERNGETIIMRMRDFGDKFDPAHVPPPKLEGEPTVGGYGVYLMHQVMDDVQYITDHAIGTELILIRRRTN